MLATVHYARFDMTPAAEAGDSAPPAMSHYIEATYRKFRWA